MNEKSTRIYIWKNYEYYFVINQNLHHTMSYSKDLDNWFGLWMRVKGPQNHMVNYTVTALGSAFG
jgi:hypothetical protein